MHRTFFKQGREGERTLLLLKAKHAAATLLMAVNLGLLVWSFVLHRQRRPVPAGYFRLLVISAVAGLFLVGVGVYFLLQGWFPLNLHLLYGTLAGVGALLQLAVHPRSGAGKAYRLQPLVHAALALFVGLVALRSWMSA